MFDASIDGLALWSPSGEIVDINPALWTMYGYSREEFLALSADGSARPSGGRALHTILRSASAGEPFHGEVADQRKDRIDTGTRSAWHSDAVPGQAAPAHDRP